MLNLKLGNQKGMVLYIVLGTLLVVVVLANIVLNLIGSQSRLTHHQVSRIQAYYAASAGVIYAYEKLKLGNDPDWQGNNIRNHTLCRTADCDIIDPDLPLPVRRVTITVSTPDATGRRTINATVDFTAPI